MFDRFRSRIFTTQSPFDPTPEQIYYDSEEHFQRCLIGSVIGCQVTGKVTGQTGVALHLHQVLVRARDALVEEAYSIHMS